MQTLEKSVHVLLHHVTYLGMSKCTHPSPSSILPRNTNTHRHAAALKIISTWLPSTCLDWHGISFPSLSHQTADALAPCFPFPSLVGIHPAARQRPCLETKGSISMPTALPGFPSLAWKGVASTQLPVRAPAFEAMDSMSMPIVIREGKAWGLMMRSGRMPVLLQ